MTNFILNIYSTLIEILLWLVVVISTIGGARLGSSVWSSSLHDDTGLAAILGGITGLLVGIVICLFFVGPLMLLGNIRDHLKKFRMTRHLSVTRQLKSMKI